MLFTRFLSVLFFLLTCFAEGYDLFDWFGSLSPKAERAKKVLEGFDAKIEQALKDFNVPGLSIGIVVDGHVVATKGYGVRDLRHALAVTPDTLFAIGSCSKAF